MNEALMKKKHLLVVCSFLCFIFSSPGLNALEPPSPQQVIIVENDWPPYFFGGSQELPGFAKELLQACIPDTGYSPSFQFYPPNRMYAYLQQGEIDIALFSHRKEREDFVMYGKESLFASSYRPVVRQDSDIKILTLNDFDNLRIGHLAGLKYSPTFQEYIVRREKEGSLTTTTGGDSALKMLLEGIIDVFVDTQDTVLWRAKEMGALQRIRIVEFDIKSSNYFITASKKSPRIQKQQDFLNTFDTCLAAMKQNGRYSTIAKKYGISVATP